MADTENTLELTADNLRSLPLPPHSETEWGEYYRAWRNRRRLLDALTRADELGVSYADLRLSLPVNYLQLVHNVRSRISAKVARNAAQRYNEKRRKVKAAPTMEVQQ